MAGRPPPKDTRSNRHKRCPPNAFQSRLTSLTPSNQDNILVAAAAVTTAAPSSSILPRPSTAPGTPHSDSIRMQSGQTPGSIAPTAQLDITIAAELEGNIIDVDATFLDRLFPQGAPFPIDNDLFLELEKKGLFNRSKNIFPPLADFKEATVCQWFNKLGEAMQQISDVKLQRRWWSGTASLPPFGSDYGFKPDLVLLDQPYYETLKPDSRVEWLFVRSFAEVTSQKAAPPRMSRTINSKTYVLSTYQFDRRFVIALSLSGSSKYVFTLTDREGQIRFLALLPNGNRDHASVFLRILSHLMFGQLSDIGIDTNFTTDPATGRLTYVLVDGRPFQLLRRLYMLEGMLGRSTKVWLVSHDNTEFILKDCWARVTGGQSEVDCLNAMAGHNKIKDSVPTLVYGGDVMIGGKLDCTTAYRDQESIGPSHGRRVHRRLVTTPIGECITKFRSKKELISAFMDIIRVHDYLANKLNILHQDISIGNVMISRQDNQGYARGLLIDFDYSGKIDKEHTMERIWTGTPPFMAIAALLNFGKPFQRTSCHDLESLLYVLIFLCTYTSGPGQKRQSFPPAMTVPLLQWFKKEKKEYVKDIGRTKIGHMMTPEDAILPKFDNYWSDFVPFVRELIQTCFPDNAAKPNKLTHTNMLAILERAINAVQDDDSATSTSPVDNRKRPRTKGNSEVPPAKKEKYALSR